MSENWANQTIDNKTEWNKRADFVGSSNSLGVQDNRFHLGDDKRFTFGYDSDFTIGYASSVDALEFRHSTSSLAGLSIMADGRLNLHPHANSSSLVKSSGALASITADQGNGLSSPYQLHISNGADWWKILNEGDVVPTADFSGNDNDTIAVPTVKAVKDFVNTSGVANSIAGATDTLIGTEQDNQMLFWDSTNSKWRNYTLSVSDGDISASNTSVGNGVQFDIQNDKVSFAKMQNIDTDKILGRSTAGNGDVEEIDCSSNGRSLLSAANMNVFDWKKFGGFSISQNFRYANNAKDVWYPVRNTVDTPIIDALNSNFDPDNSNYDLRTHELARCLFFVAPKAGTIEGLYYSYATEDNDITSMDVLVTKYDADTDTFGSLYYLSGALVIKDNNGPVSQYKFNQVNYIDLGHSFNAGDGFAAFVRTKATATAKPDANYSIVMTGSYT